MVRNYIGLACTGHENAIAIVDARGEIVFAEAAERYLQNKRAINSPPDDMMRMPQLIERYCDPTAELVVAKSWSRSAAEKLRSDAGSMLRAVAGLQPSTDREWISRVMFHAGLWSSLIGPNCQLAGAGVARYCNTRFRKFSVRECDHHLTHAAYACFESPFDEAVCLIVDGYGEGVSHAFFHYREGRIEAIDHPRSAKNAFGSLSSLGLFYGYTVCALLGLEITNGEEWKVMGLAPYGRLDERLLEVLQRHIRVEGLDLVMDEGSIAAYRELQSFSRKAGQPIEEMADVAFTAQHHFGEMLFAMLDGLAAMGLSDNLVFGGGCALNSTFNGLIAERTPFRAVFVPPAPSDDGNAIGAALLAHRADHPEPRPPVRLHSPYLGSPVDPRELDRYLEGSKMLGRVPIEADAVCGYVARQLAEGKVVAWMQGRAEFGPRALGNRSILADPRDPGMKDRINAIVKFREGFRPFAPSILDEHGDEWFENYVATPYMERTLRIREPMRRRIPAVCHADSTGRLQSVTRASNARFHRLIECFFELTGVPVLLNTSLNVMGKPIVHGVGDAVNLFLASRIDLLVCENHVFSKPGTAPGANTPPPVGERLAAIA